MIAVLRAKFVCDTIKLSGNYTQQLIFKFMALKSIYNELDAFRSII